MSEDKRSSVHAMTILYEDEDESRENTIKAR
jgi:hypothetical protein